MGFNNEEIRNYAAFLNALTPNELATIASLAGLFLSQGLTSSQQNSVGNFLEAIGQIMQCIAAQAKYLEEKNEKKIKI